MDKFYAHSTDRPDKADWQLLEEHLKNVALLAENFAKVFGAGDWGRLAGLLHDAGKATRAFQRRLEGNPQRVDHSTFGARIAAERFGSLGLLLAYAITGHHGGLRDGGEQETQLHHRLNPSYRKVPEDAQLISSIALPAGMTPPFRLQKGAGGFPLAHLTRMLFSCLVDADFLDTERFCSPEKASLRQAKEQVPLTSLKDLLDSHLSELVTKSDPTPVNKIRAEILDQCRRKATGKPGIFSLTVPTGGGKTLSSLTFALDHAVANNLRRVIYAIPFTSIIEQNARVFQDILGLESVLEHHCNYKENDDPEEAAYNRRRGMAAENWDAPLVVTTNVQLFESLFSHKPSRCRKLHNIAGSVIILDEAQAIPTEFLEPCLAVLKELVEHYSCSIILCTATQPALDSSQVKTALPNIEEVVSNPEKLFEDLHRTEVSFVGKLTDDELTARIDAERQVLCIVSTKKQARGLFEQLQNSGGFFHLSTNMYPEHRRSVLQTIRERLNAGEECRVISTSLVEAGVDLDFPVVYRAMAGLDSIAQAAGRCNREGRLNEKGELGRVYVFEAEQPPRMPWLKRCATRAAEVLRAMPMADPLGIEAMRRYFELHYDVENLDKEQIFTQMNELTRELSFPFRTVAEQFCFIEEETIGVIIPATEEVEKQVSALLFTEFPRSILRKLQAYSVAVRTKDFQALDRAGALEMVGGEFPVLRNMQAYGEFVGLCVDEGEVWNPENLITS